MAWSVEEAPEEQAAGVAFWAGVRAEGKRRRRGNLHPSWVGEKACLEGVGMVEVMKAVLWGALRAVVVRVAAAKVAVVRAVVGREAAAMAVEATAAAMAVEVTAAAAKVAVMEEVATVVARVEAARAVAEMAGAVPVEAREAVTAGAETVEATGEVAMAVAARGAAARAVAAMVVVVWAVVKAVAAMAVAAMVVVVAMVTMTRAMARATCRRLREVGAQLVAVARQRLRQSVRRSRTTSTQ